MIGRIMAKSKSKDGRLCMPEELTLFRLTYRTPLGLEVRQKSPLWLRYVYIRPAVVVTEIRQSNAKARSMQARWTQAVCTPFFLLAQLRRHASPP